MVLLLVGLVLTILSVVICADSVVVVEKRVMAPGVPDIEGSNHGHDVIPVKSALSYFKHRGYSDEMYNEIENVLSNIKPSAFPYLYVGSTREKNANRVVFGEAVSDVLDGLSKEEAAKKVVVIDSPHFYFDVRCDADIDPQVISPALPV
jgi:hypothetical protein